MQKIDYLTQIGKLVKKSKHEHIFVHGDSDRSFYILKSGLLKAYYVTQDGKEYVKSFIAPGSFIGSLTACYANEVCSFSLSCMEDCEYIEVQFGDLKKAALNNQELAEFMINGLLQLAMKKEKREYEFLCLSAESRYQLLTKQNPEIIKRATQNDIARYLGITPVALSRIKSRLEKS